MTERTRFQWDLAQDVEVSQCLYCLHWVPGGTCAAFPEGIPSAILENGIDHRNPVAGDRGVRFTPSAPDSILKVEELFADRELQNGDTIWLQSGERVAPLQRRD